MTTTTKTNHTWTAIIAIVLFGIGIFAFTHLLHSVDMAAVKAQMRATPAITLLGAVASTAVAYLALTGYDWWGLRQIGHKLPASVVGLGGFLGCAFGNTVGVSFLSGGAVRYRIYSVYGLSGIEVAALSTYIAAAIGIGLTVIGTGALAIHPGALGSALPLSETVIRWGSLGAMVAMLVVLYAFAFSGRTLSVGRFRIDIPSAPVLTGQFLVNLLDVFAAAFTLWLLLPAGKPDFATLVAIYAAATMVGVLSHVPGGVGVFETAVLAAMPSTVSPTEVAAALLLFRFIYYLLPFGIGFAVIALNELRNAGGLLSRITGPTSKQLLPAFNSVDQLAPSLIATVVFGSGMVLIASALVPWLNTSMVAEGDMIGVMLSEFGNGFAALAGGLMVFMSLFLLRQSKWAYWLSIVVLIAGMIELGLDSVDREGAMTLAIFVLIFLPFGKFFKQ